MLTQLPQTGAIDQGASPPLLSLLYRGTLSSCNYDCRYCPFAKRQDGRATLARDAQELARFVSWLKGQTRAMRILFTPWGEALVRRHYRHAMLELSRLPHIGQVALQTNLSGPLAWLEETNPEKIAFWCTYHPSQTTLERFIKRCEMLMRAGIKFSVGSVAMPEHYDAIRLLRAALPPEIHVWLNAFDRRGPGYYRQEDLAWLDQIDPWFQYNRRPVPSRGQPCRAGEEMIFVNGDGELQRCHFLPERLGNLYSNALSDVLHERPCTRHKCDCYIGYAHRKDLPFYADFGSGVLARIPLKEAANARKNELKKA